MHLDKLSGHRLVALADHQVVGLELVGGRLARGDIDLGLLWAGHAGHAT